MFHLQTRVHLEEIEVLIFVNHKFQSSGTVITDPLAGDNGCLGHLFAGLDRDERRRTFLDHLLITPLDGTLTIAQMDQIAVSVAQNLHFDMMRMFDIFLNVNGIITK